MLYLKDNNLGINVIYANLLDRLPTNALANINNWSYLFSITNDFTKVNSTMLFTLNDCTWNSDNIKIAYPMEVFNLASSGANGLLQQIEMVGKGYYSYEIYYQDSITNLDLSIAIQLYNAYLVENGKSLMYDNIKEVQYKERNTVDSNYIYVP